MYNTDQRNNLFKDIQNLIDSNDSKFMKQVENARSLGFEGNAVYCLAYFMMQSSILKVSIIQAKGRLAKNGVSPQMIEEIFKVHNDSLSDKVTKSDLAFYEQNQRVRSGLVKPALKRDITTEKVVELYRKYGTYKAVADILGIDPRTVKSRLKNIKH